MPGLFPLHLPCAFIRPPGKALQLVREGMQPAGEGQGGCRQERASGPRSLGECCTQQIVRVGKEDGRAGKEEQRTGREKDLFFLRKEGKRILDGERWNSPFLASGSRGMEDPKN